jgi:hypothetical protein
MKDTQEQPHFASSFFWGACFGAAGLYLVGTKQGRHILKRLMDSVEKLENSTEDIFEVLEDKLDGQLNEESLQNLVELGEKKEEHHVPSSNLHSVMEKIKLSLPSQK